LKLKFIGDFARFGGKSNEIFTNSHKKCKEMFFYMQNYAKIHIRECILA